MKVEIKVFGDELIRPKAKQPETHWRLNDLVLKNIQEHLKRKDGRYEKTEKSTDMGIC